RGSGLLRGGSAGSRGEGSHAERRSHAEGSRRNALREDLSDPGEGRAPAQGRKRRPPGHRQGGRSLQGVQGGEGAADAAPRDAAGIAAKAAGGGRMKGKPEARVANRMPAHEGAAAAEREVR